MGIHQQGKALTWFDGAWGDGARPLVAATSNALWQATAIFDGARAFDGFAPDLDLHCQRANRSAAAMGLKPLKTATEIETLCREGIRQFPPGAELYIKPLYWADHGFVAPDPESTRFALTVSEAPLPPRTGFAACLSSRRRPAPDCAPTHAKAACLYPNAGLALVEARDKGFQNAVMLDPVGNVAEFATANLFLVKDGAVITPVPNGCFLNGITRQRVIQLLAADGIRVVERSVRPEELSAADEIFSTGNYGKVQPVTRFGDRNLPLGPVSARAWDLYMAFARGQAA